MSTVRTRFAPSPTGYLHVGGIRTALFAWLVARQNNGKFILRIEDTDRARLVPEAEKHIIDSLQQLGLDYDEGPFTQSTRTAKYIEKANELLAKGRAYVDPFTPEQVQAFRDQDQKAKKPFLYRNHLQKYLEDGNVLPAWDGEQSLRFKSDPKAYKWHDEVMGNLEAGPEVIDDFIILKSAGGDIPNLPTYNFAHIVDDTDMQITHVIRGQEFLSSIPNYLNLYEAFGETPPLFATVPHILNESGNKKLSKRDGAKDVLDYIREGFLPEALVNFIASLGWNDGTEQEIFSRAELVKKFSLNRVNRSGAHFDERRLLWMNGSYIRVTPLDELYAMVKDYWPAEASGYDEGYKKQVLALVQERLKYFAELPALSRFFFTDLPVDLALISTHKQLSKLPTDQLKTMLTQAREALEDSNFTVEDLADRLNRLLKQTGQKPAVLFSLIRIATTQAPASPGLADTLAVLGKERSLQRLNSQLSAL